MTQLTLLDSPPPVQQEDNSPVQTAKVHVGPKLAEYRRNVWNIAAQKTLAANPTLAQKVSIAFILAGEADNIKDYSLMPYYQKITGESQSITDATNRGDRVAYALSVVDCLNQSEETKLITATAVVLMPHITETKVKTTLMYLGVNLSNFWKMEKAFLMLLTKTEIEAVAKELGVSRYMGTSFAKAGQGKKDEFVDAILSSGYDFTGKVPSVLAYNQQESGE